MAMEAHIPTEPNEPGRPTQPENPVLRDTFLRLAKAAKVTSDKQMMAIANASRPTVFKWKKKGLMSEEYILLWAEYFGVTPGYLRYGRGQHNTALLEQTVLAALELAEEHEITLAPVMLAEAVAKAYIQCDATGEKPKDYLRMAIRLLSMSAA